MLPMTCKEEEEGKKAGGREGGKKKRRESPLWMVRKSVFEQHPKGRCQTGVNGSEETVLFSLSTTKPALFSLQKLVSRL